MKLFTAFSAKDLSFDPKVALKKVKTNLLKKEIEHRWVPVENYHCTLNFLGEVDREKVGLLKEILMKASEHHQEFELKIHGLDAFPEIKEGRVLWLGVQNTKELRLLHQDCLNILKENGFHSEERPYIPHLTVARLRNPRNLKDIISPVASQNFGRLIVKRLSLYESQSGGAFPVYKELAGFPLKPYLPISDEMNLM